jgi:hypothetical protein
VIVLSRAVMWLLRSRGKEALEETRREGHQSRVASHLGDSQVSLGIFPVNSAAATATFD